MAFRIEEAVKLPDCRQPASDRRGGESAPRQRRQISAQIGGGGRQRGAPAGRQKGGKIAEVAPVGGKRIGGSAAFRRDHVEELRGQLPGRNGVRHAV